MALSANASYTIRNDRAKTFTTVTVATGAIIYQHALVSVKATGNRAIGAQAGTATTYRFVGLAVECSTRSFPCTGDTAGTVTVDAYIGMDVLLPCTGITDGNVNDAVYAISDDKGHDFSTLGPQIGVLRQFVSATQSWVRLGATALGDPT